MRVLKTMTAATALVLALALPVSAHAATGPGRAVVLVSGFTTDTPFTTPDPSCAGKEGPTWDPSTGVAATLRASGYSVFTVPVKQESGQPATPCAPGTEAPPLSDYIDSNGDVNANGDALANFFAFLHANYGINEVDLVAHSDGGLWSRSAITQRDDFPGVTIDSLTTLGTPHTGSFEADIAEGIDNGQCNDPSRPIVEAVCLALRDFAESVLSELGPTAVKELSSDYLASWNPEQKIGGCPVTGVAGTYFKLPLPPSQLPDYYNPSDVLVGQASALGQPSSSIWGTEIPGPGIPNFIDGGSFPVVHSATFSYLTPANLLNTQAISNEVLAALGSVSSTDPPCTAKSSPPNLTDGVAKRKIPLHAFEIPRKGRLPKPRRSDVILHTAPAGIFCRGNHLASFPFLGRRKLRVTHPSCKSPLRVFGSDRALLIRTGGKAVFKIKGRSVKLRLRGVKPRAVILRVERGDRFVPVPLGGLEGRVPPGKGPTSVRIRVTPRHGPPLSGGATVSR